MTSPIQAIGSLLQHQQAQVLTDWLRQIEEAGLAGLARQDDVKKQASELLHLVAEAAAQGKSGVLLGDSAALQGFLKDFSDARVRDGFTSEQTATFVFALKRPLFQHIQNVHRDDALRLAELIISASELLDSLGLKTIDAYQRSRESVIRRQQDELLELSTPVVKLWDGVLALPIIGTLDSARAQVMMESLLERIAATESEIAIIDITGVPTVDTLVAQHLIKTVTAIRLMGSDCIISGVRPQIAQTIVHLGVDLGAVTTKANLADALALAMKRGGAIITKRAS